MQNSLSLSVYTDEDTGSGDKLEGFPRPARRGDSYPGVQGVGRKDRKLYHRYYQWVCFVLLFQGLSFYIPRYIWKVWDAGRLKLLVSGLQVHSFNSSQQATRKDQIVEYFMSHRGSWGLSYAFKFYFCKFGEPHLFSFMLPNPQLYLSWCKIWLTRRRNPKLGQRWCSIILYG